MSQHDSSCNCEQCKVDSKTLDVFLVDEDTQEVLTERPTLLVEVDPVRLDVATHPWLACGLPETLVVDNGRAFIGEDLEDACGQLGINLEPNPNQGPWLKGSIERFFKTNNTSVIHGLPETSFSNVAERGDYSNMSQHHPSGPFARYEIDFQEFDLFLVDEDTQEVVTERPTFLIEIDPVSQMIISVRLEPLTPEDGDEDSAT